MRNVHAHFVVPLNESTLKKLDMLIRNLSVKKQFKGSIRKKLLTGQKRQYRMSCLLKAVKLQTKQLTSIP